MAVVERCESEIVSGSKVHSNTSIEVRCFSERHPSLAKTRPSVSPPSAQAIRQKHSLWTSTFKPPSSAIPMLCSLLDRGASRSYRFTIMRVHIAENEFSATILKDCTLIFMAVCGRWMESKTTAWPTRVNLAVMMNSQTMTNLLSISPSWLSRLVEENHLPAARLNQNDGMCRR